MESLLSLLVFLPTYIKKIDNKYLTSFMFVAVGLFISVTLFVNYEVTSIYINEFSYTLTGLKQTEYFILLVLGLISQLIITSDSRPSIKSGSLQVLMMLWFGLIDNTPFVIIFGYFFIDMLSSVKFQRNRINKLLTFLLLVIGFINEKSLFNMDELSSHLIILISILLIIMNLNRISVIK